VEDRSEANLVIINPYSPVNKHMATENATFWDKHPIKQEVISYRLLAFYCLLGDDRTHLTKTFSSAATGIFVNPQTHQPLRAWVSVNVHMNLKPGGGTETPEEAQAAVIKELVRGGALIVRLRARADLLVVDRTSAFCRRIIIPEKIDKKRTHQRLKERDWVSCCVSQSKCAWDEVPDEDENSFGEDPAPKKVPIARVSTR
jgi:hypothetical protein